MRAIVYTAKGDTSVIVLQEMPDPAPRENEVLIEVSVSGLNRADILQRKGSYPPPAGESQIPGLELCGRIVKRGAGANRFELGDRVMALTASGAHASLAIAHQDLCLPVPEALSDLEAGAFTEAFLTAHHNLFHLGQLQPGETVLIHAGGSGVGTAAIKLTQKRAQVFTTVGQDEKAQLCAKLGANAIHYKKEKFDEVILKNAPQGVNLILDCIGAAYFTQNLRALALDGRWVVIGLMGGREGQADWGGLLGKRARMIFSTLRNLPLSEKAAIVRRFETQMGAELQAGRLRPVIDSHFQATQMAQAQERMESNQNLGKILITWK